RSELPAGPAHVRRPGEDRPRYARRDVDEETRYRRLEASRGRPIAQVPLTTDYTDSSCRICVICVICGLLFAVRFTINGFSQNQKNTHANTIVAGTTINTTFTS